MKLATIRTGGSTAAVRIDGDRAVELGARDVREVLDRDGWRSWAEAANGAAHDVAGLDYAPLVPSPDKIICVGLNYRSHVAEMGHPMPDHPTLFAKYRAALIGAHDDIVLPAVSTRIDWEAELAIIIGARTRNVAVGDAAGSIAGYSVLNDVSVRDWQNRTSQFLQGKTFESSTPLGPWLVTPDESPGPDREISCEVDGELMQKSTTADLVFDAETLVSYVSTIITLEPGDVIATGTPAGVGAAHSPPRWLRDGSVVVTRIAGVGELRNTCRAAVST